jgi:hypothetical protein
VTQISAVSATEKPSELTRRRCAHYVAPGLKLVLAVAIKRWTMRSTVITSLAWVEIPLAGNETNFVDPADEC